MLLAQHFLADGDGFAVERLGLAVLALAQQGGSWMPQVLPLGPTSTKAVPSLMMEVFT
jgi:hypothetical protein